MEVHDFFLQLLVILLAARVCAELATYLKSPSVVGELVAGIVLGPSVLGYVEPNDVLRLLAEIGIILLLFEVGLETDLKRLLGAGQKSMTLAVLGFVLPFGLGFVICRYLFQLPELVSLFIGGTITATSIGITVRVLTDLGRQSSHEAQVVLGAAVIDDILGVVLLAVLYQFSLGKGISLMSAGKVLLFIGIFFLLAPIAAKLIARVIRRYESQTAVPGLIPTTIVSLVLFFAWLAHAVGAPEIIGGFAAGLALSRRFFLPLGIAMHTDVDFSHRIEQQMRPIIQLFTPIFFVMVGLSMDLSAIDWNVTFIWMFSLALLLAAILGKIAGAYVVSRHWAERAAIGAAMTPRGEVGLIFAELGRTTDILSNEVYAAIVLVIALTTLLPPFFLKWLYRRYGDRLPPQETVG